MLRLSGHKRHLANVALWLLFCGIMAALGGCPSDGEAGLLIPGGRTPTPTPTPTATPTVVTAALPGLDLSRESRIG
jgi:hypothetical protein